MYASRLRTLAVSFFGFALLGGCAIAGKFDSEAQPRHAEPTLAPQILQSLPPTDLIQLPLPITPGPPGVVSVISTSREQAKDSTWFAATGLTESGIGVVSNEGLIHFFPIESGPSRRPIQGFTVASDGFWVSVRGRSGSSAYHVSSTGGFVEFSVQNEVGPLAADSDGAWFADNAKTQGGAVIGFVATIDPAGVATYYRIPGNYRVRNVASYYNGDVLFSAEDTTPGGGGFIGMMDQTGTIVKEFAVSNGRYPDSIAWTQGYIWSALHPSPHSKASEAMAQINGTTGVITEFPTSVIPNALVGGSAHQLIIFTACAEPGCPPGSWEIDQMALSGRLTTIFRAGSTNSLNGFTIGADGNFWVGDSSTNIDVFVRNPISVDPTSLTLPVGQSGTLTAFTKRSQLFAVSSNPQVAKISSVSGEQFTITAVKKGTCFIHFYTAHFNATNVNVTVTAPN